MSDTLDINLVFYNYFWGGFCPVHFWQSILSKVLNFFSFLMQSNSFSSPHKENVTRRKRWERNTRETSTFNLYYQKIKIPKQKRRNPEKLITYEAETTRKYWGHSSLITVSPSRCAPTREQPSPWGQWWLCGKWGCGCLHGQHEKNAVQKHALNVILRGHTGFVSPFAFLLLISQMCHYTHNPSAAHTLHALRFLPLGCRAKVWL